MSFNLNGLRSAIKKGWQAWAISHDWDIIALQEIKARPEDIDTPILEKQGYQLFWTRPEKKGYSGLAVWTKMAPLHVHTHCHHPLFDAEGRILTLEFKDFNLINAYFPSGSSGDHRQAVKMEFLAFFLPFLQSWQQKGKPLIVCGDFNICHRAIDIHDPIRNARSSGFLPEERAWMDEFFQNDMVDAFRLLHPEPHQYSWWSYRSGARARNKGWRIDYITLSSALMTHLQGAQMWQEAVYSDHCPVSVKLSW